MHTTGNRGGNLILIGFMGTGKTCVGRGVAKSLGFRFVDTDELITKKAGKSIPEIFAQSGESAFRRLETEVLKECLQSNGQVISTGGGIVTKRRNLLLLKKGGYVIWLKASAETIYERVRHNSNRPLLATKDPLGTIRKLLEDRSERYHEAAQLEIATDNLTLDETTFGVTESARLALVS